MLFTMVRGANYLIMNKKPNKIRFKITAGWEDLNSFLTTVESYAHFKNFEVTFNKTKQWRDTPIYEAKIELTKLEDRKI